jgi:hypothetical protein
MVLQVILGGPLPTVKSGAMSFRQYLVRLILNLDESHPVITTNQSIGKHILLVNACIDARLDDFATVQRRQFSHAISKINMHYAIQLAA